MVLVEGGQTVDDAVCANLFRVVHQKRNAGAHPRLNQYVWYRRPVLLEHQTDLVEHRRHGRESCSTGQVFGVVTDQAVDGECKLIGGHLGFGANPPVLHHLRVVA